MDNFDRPDETRLITWFRVFLIYFSAMITLPAFVMGAELAHGMGALDAAWASFLGAAILALLAGFGGMAGARTRMSTYELIHASFGHRSSALMNAMLGLTLLGWYGVVALLFGKAASSVAQPWLSLHLNLWVFIGSLVCLLTALYGIKALDRVSWVVTPLKCGLLITACYVALQSESALALASPSGAAGMGLTQGMGVVIGGLVVGAILAPDVCRFAKTPRHALWACIAAFGIGFPGVLVMSGLPSLATGEKDLVQIMLSLGLGIPAFLIVVLSAWSTNSFNLYASSLATKTLFQRLTHAKLVWVLGALGTTLGWLGADQWLIPYLIVLSVCIPPIAGVYLVMVFMFPQRLAQPTAHRWSAWCSWLLGAAWGLLANNWGIGISPTPALDSFILTALALIVSLRLQKNQAA